MRVVIISDVHANMEALEALPETGDQLWVLGDLVNYGPDPAAVVDWVREHATVVIRGNHDHAAATGEDPRCSAPFREMSRVMLAYTRTNLSLDQHEYLGELPLTRAVKIDDTAFFLCHAAPSQPLFEYVGVDSPQWERESEATAADVLLTGHTHIPFIRAFGGRIVANPGSIGQPKTGSPLASYAVWDGRLELHSYRYDWQTTVRKIETMPIPENVKSDLAGVLARGGLVEGGRE
jgi:protein phosphatase